jgi:TPR repeat protein
LVTNPHDELPIKESDAVQWHQKVGANPKLKQLAERGDPEAQFVYATYLRDDTCYVRQYLTDRFDIHWVNPLAREGVGWLRKAAEQGYPPAKARVALDYVFDAATAEMDANKAKAEADYADAARWYRKAAEHGNRGAQAELAGFYEKGTGLPPSYADAAEWFLAAAKRGEGEAQYEIGIYSYEGSGIRQDYEVAFLWWKRYVAPGPPKRDISTPDEWIRHYFTVRRLLTSRRGCRR